MCYWDRGVNYLDVERRGILDGTSKKPAKPGWFGGFLYVGGYFVCIANRILRRISSRLACDLIM